MYEFIFLVCRQIMNAHVCMGEFIEKVNECEFIFLDTCVFEKYNAMKVCLQINF